jgi:hypothetical protein
LLGNGEELFGADIYEELIELIASEEWIGV